MMPRYRAIYDKQGLLAEFEGETAVFVRADYNPPEKADFATPMIMRDIQPYKNMIDGRMITSRSEHRTLLRDHNCVEIGNEAMKSVPKPPKSDRRERLHRQLADVSDREANKVLKQLKRDFRS